MTSSTDKPEGFFARPLALIAGSVLAILVVHFPMVRSGFALTQADLLDSRFNNYLLEHSYRWLTGAPGHTSFWSPPFCHPAPNLLAYSDVMVSFAPPYCLARFAGFEPDTAFQLWMLFATATNFLLAYLLLRRGFRFAPTASWCGAMLFAIASSRTAQLGHQQLYCQAYVLIAFFSLIRIARFVGADPRVRPLGARNNWADTGVRPYALAMTAIVLQFWGGFYMAFFLVLSIATAVTWALILSRTRSSLLKRVVALARRPLVWLIAALALAALFPLASHYLQVARNASVPDNRAVTAMLPAPKSWLYTGPDSLLYRRLDPLYSDLPAPFEHAIGLGILTTIIAALGLWRSRRNPFFAVLSLTALTLIFITTRFGDHASLWWPLRSLIPGAVAIRAVARIGLLLTIPAAVGFAAWVAHLQSRRPARIAVLVLVTLCFAEQLRSPHAYDKYAMRAEVNSIAARIPPGSKAFLYTGRDPDHWAVDQVDAMWASLQTHTPTINGYSGTWPPALRKLIMSDTLGSPQNYATIKQELELWQLHNHLPPSSVAWIIDAHPGEAVSLGN
jgi:hypothetical protein